jgi:arabinogalactan oligomer / maltooligosaccharide transport system substrate-binding protein
VSRGPRRSVRLVGDIVDNWRRWVIGLPVAALLLSACGPGDDAADEPVTEEPDLEEETDEDTDEDADLDDADGDDADAAEEDGEDVVRADADLVIWADALVADVLGPIADDFGDANEIEVAVQEVDGGEIRDRLITSAPAGEGPDMIVGAHDWLGELVANGVISTVDLAGAEADLEDVAVEAFTFEGQTYGFPYATENIALYRNTDLVPDLPADWEELEQIALDLQEEGEVEHGVVWPTDPGDDVYHAYPVTTAYGGYVFGEADDGGYDLTDIGLDSDGNVQAAERIVQMLSEGVLARDMSYELVVEQFAGENAAFAITGPWALPDMEGAPFEVTPIPPIEGGTPAPFVGVQGFMVSAFAENELLAQTFLLDEIGDPETQVELFEAGNRPPALTSALEEVADDPNIEGFAEAAADGEPMPAIPEMGSVFDVWGQAQVLIFEEAQEPEPALSDAADQLRGLLE